MNSRIATDSKRQTMDWSLALVSQGIEATVDHSEEAGWGLIVDEHETAHAQSIIRQYQKENRHWPWQQKISIPPLAFDWGSLAWTFLLSLFFLFNERNASFRDYGIMNNAAISRGEWWRLFTAIYLHADLGHLASNAGIGFVLLGLAMGRFGTGLGLLAGFLAGAVGNVSSWLVYPINHQSLGASGMVMGCLGLLATQSVSILGSHPQKLKLAVGGLAAGGMLFVLMGLSPGTDVVAHLGGFLGGVLLGVPLTFLPRLARDTRANVMAGALFSALTIIAWWLALGRLLKIS